MNIKNKKSSALVIAIYFIIVSLITSAGLYTYAWHVSREVSIQEPTSIRGYYASIAGLRYAYILLQDPQANFGFDANWNGQSSAPVDLTSTLGPELEFAGNDHLEITVTEYNASNPSSTPWDVNNYQVSASFTS